MLKKILFTATAVFLSQYGISQVTKLVADGKQVTSVTEKVNNNGKASFPKVPETLTIIFPADFYNYKAMLSNGKDTGKDLVLTYNDTKPDSKTVIISNQSATVDLTFLNGSLWAIGGNKLNPAVTVPVDAKGGFTIQIASNAQPADKPQPAATKTICDNITGSQTVLSVIAPPADNPFLACLVQPTGLQNNNTLPYRYGLRLATDNTYPKYATSASYLLIYDVRKKPAFSPYAVMKIKQDTKNKIEYFEPLKGPFHPKAGTSMVVQIIGEKDSTYVLKSDSTIRFMTDEQTFITQITPQSTGTTTAPTETEEELHANNVIPGRADSSKKASVNAKAQDFKRNLVWLESGLYQFNETFTDINFKENSYNTARDCLKMAIESNFGIPTDNAQLLADGLIQKSTLIPIDTKNYQDFCTIIQAIKQLYDEAINKTVTYSSFLTEMPVPDVDIFNVHIQSSNLKTDLTNKEFYVSSGLKIDFSTGIFYTSLGNPSFVVGSVNFQYRDAIQKVDPSTGNITTTYNPNLISDTRKVIMKNGNHSFGTGVLAHAYVRTGSFFNVGLATGIFLNASQVQGLIGPSIMLGNKTRRFCLSGGLAVGQETTLSAENQQYFYSGKTTIYNSVNNVPVAYTSDSSPATANHMKYDNWFVALTYNLSSTKTSK